MKNTKRKWWWPFCCGTVVINNYYNQKRKPKKKKNAFEVNKGKVIKYDPESRTGIIESRNKQYKLIPETIFIDPIEEGMVVDFTGLQATNQKITPIMYNQSQSDNLNTDYTDTALSVAFAYRGDPPTGQLEPIKTSGPGGRTTNIVNVTNLDDPHNIFESGENIYFLQDDSGTVVYISTELYSSGDILSDPWVAKINDVDGEICTVEFGIDGSTPVEYDVYH